jgi:hypothetical protein
MSKTSFQLSVHSNVIDVIVKAHPLFPSLTVPGVWRCVAEKIIICLWLTQWEQLKPHLPGGVCESVGGPDEGFLTLEGRIIPDEETYQKVLAIAKKHCRKLVPDIEKQRRLSAEKANRY